MSYTAEEIRDRLKELCQAPIIAFWAKVTAVNEDESSCTVQPDDESPELDQVMLKADLEETDGIVEIPAIGSRVIVLILHNDEDTAFVAKTTKVEKVLIYGGKQKGLVLHDALKAVLDQQNTILTALKTVAAATVSEPGNGSPSAFQAALNSAIAGLQVPLTNSLENKKILQ
jgi:hypothetical protein